MPKRRTSSRPSQPSAEPRRRVYAACSQCRRRRRKCNGRQPCAQCESYGYACAYEAEQTLAAPSSVVDAATPVHPPETSRSRPARADQPGVIVSRDRGGRFINATSAVALPHLVGQALAVSPPLRLHSYAWNLGLRPERRGAVSASLADHLTLSECQALSAVYFATIHPLFAFLDQDAFSQRLVATWSTTPERSQPNFAAVVALVAALGSFFSAAPHLREDDAKRHGLAILDLGLSNPVAAVDLDAVAGWILRTLYMRLTTRPAVSCLASHTAVHVAEIMGLHRDLVDGDDAAAAAAAKSSFGREELEARRRYFCVARFLNVLLAAEYGVSSVAPRQANHKAPANVPGTHIHVLHTMAGVLQDAEGADLDSDDYADLFRRLQEITHDDDTVALFTADVCLSLLRRFAAASRTPTPGILSAAAAILRRALDGITALLEHQRPWWNMLSVPFQSVCVAASAADHAGFLEMAPAAMALLRAMADTFGSHMAREALATAQQLLAASRARTQATLAVQDAALAHALPAVDVDWAAFDEVNFDMGGDWPALDFFT